MPFFPISVIVLTNIILKYFQYMGGGGGEGGGGYLHVVV